MATATRIARRLLWQGMSPLLAVDMLFAVMAVAVIGLAVVVPLQDPLDALQFARRASYGAVRTASLTSEAAGETHATVVRGVPVGIELPKSSGSGSPVVFGLADIVTVHLVEDIAHYSSHVLGRNAPSFPVGEGVLVDRVTARRLDLDAGEALTIHTFNLPSELDPTGGERTGLSVRVAGVTEPLGTSNGRAQGLVVAQAALFPVLQRALSGAEVPPRLLSAQQLQRADYSGEIPEDSAGWQSRDDVAARAISAMFAPDRLSRLMTAVACGIVLWFVACVRGARFALRRMERRIAMLAVLGVDVPTLRRAVLGPFLALAGGTALIGMPVLRRASAAVLGAPVDPVLTAVPGTLLAVVSVLAFRRTAGRSSNYGEAIWTRRALDHNIR